MGGQGVKMSQPARDKANRPRWPFDFLRYVFAPRKYKPLPAPGVHYDDEPRVLWAINRKWLSHVIGTVDLLAQDDAWTGDDDARYMATQEAERMMVQNLPLISPELLKFKRISSGSSWRLLVSFDGGTSWNDTDYTFIGNAVRETAVHQDVTEINTAEVLGSVEAIDTPASPTAERIFRTYLIHLDKSKLERGDTGAQGKGIFFVDPPSTVIDPNQSPEIAIVGETDDGQFVQAALPRQRTQTVGDVVPLEPGSVPTVVYHETETGDLIVDYGLVTGATGGTGSSGIKVDDVPPEPGNDKDFEVVVPWDGVTIGFPLLTGDIVTVPEQAKGLWVAYDSVGDVEYVMDENGIDIGAAHGVGKLVMGVKLPSDTRFQEGLYNNAVTIDTDNSYIRWRQAQSTGFIGNGYLSLKYNVYRPVNTIILQEWDWRTATQNWNPVDFDHRVGNSYGGYYDLTGVFTTQGWKPSANAVEGFGCFIQSPQFNPVHISAMEIFWDAMNGDGAYLLAYGRHNNSSNWEPISETVAVSGASGSYTLNNFSSGTWIECGIYFSKYQHTGDDLRLYKAIIS